MTLQREGWVLWLAKVCKRWMLRGCHSLIIPLRQNVSGWNLLTVGLEVSACLAVSEWPFCYLALSRDASQGWQFGLLAADTVLVENKVGFKKQTWRFA